MFNYSNTVIWLWLIKYWNRSSPRVVYWKTLASFYPPITTWSGAEHRLWLTRKTTALPPRKLLNHSLLFVSSHRISFSYVWLWKICISTSCCLSEPLSPSHAWNQSICLLSNSDYSRSVPWLQPETGRCLLICGLNTETGKFQGSYQGYLKSAAPFLSRFIIRFVLYSAVEFGRPCMLI